MLCLIFLSFFLADGKVLTFRLEPGTNKLLLGEKPNQAELTYTKPDDNTPITGTILGSLPPCFTDTYRARDGSPVEQATTDNADQYFELTRYTLSDGHINVLLNKNNLPDVCYWGEVDGKQFSCTSTTFFYNNQDFTCKVDGNADAITFKIMKVDRKWFSDSAIPAKERKDETKPHFSVQFSLETDNSESNKKKAATEKVAKTIATVRAFEMQKLFKDLEVISKHINTRWITLNEWMTTWWNLAYLGIPIASILVPSWLIFCCSWVGCLNAITGCLIDPLDEEEDWEESCNAEGGCGMPCCGPHWWDATCWAIFCIILCTILFTGSDIVAPFAVIFGGICFVVGASLLYCCMWSSCCFTNCCSGWFNCCKCFECCEKISMSSGDLSGNAGDPSTLELTQQGQTKEAWSTSEMDEELCQCYVSQTIPSCAPVEQFCEGYLFNIAHKRRLYSKQYYWVLACSIIGAILALILSIVFLAPKIEPYKVYMRTTLKDEGMVKNEVAKTDRFLQLFYAMDYGFKSQWLDKLSFSLMSATCGKLFNTNLTTVADKKARIEDAYITALKIDMSIYFPSSYKDYDTVNTWFYRNLRPNEDNVMAVRPIYGVGRLVPVTPTNTYVVSPADCRFIGMPKVPSDQKIWLKDSGFTIKELLLGVTAKFTEEEEKSGSGRFGGDALNYPKESIDMAKKFFENDKKPTMMIFRLAPEDYHRWHWPLEGTIKGFGTIDNYLHSVNADAMTSGNHAIYNKRRVHYVQNEAMGKDNHYAIIYLGAMCTGSMAFCPPGAVNVMAKTGQDKCKDEPELVMDKTYTTGQMSGNFAFGGSTIVMLFQEGTVELDGDLEFTSTFPVEQYLTQGARVATVIPV